MCMNCDGKLLATSNDNGRIIRIHSCISYDLLQEFERGNEKTEINYICFDNLNKFLGVTSERGTLHIWSLGSTIKKMKEINKSEPNIWDDLNHNPSPSESTITNSEGKINAKGDSEPVSLDKNSINLNKATTEKLPENKRSIFSGFGFRKGEFSFAQVKNLDPQCICAFVPENKVVIVTSQGKYIQAQIDINKGGECKILMEKSLMETEDKKNK